jgi:hypothetical protein
LKSLKIPFFYEPKNFIFPGIKRGTISYLPDLYLPETDEYIEIKGQLTGKGRTAIRRLAQFYPEEFKKLRMVPASPNTKAAKFAESAGIPIYAYYNELDKKYKDRKLIPEWE